MILALRNRFVPHERLTSFDENHPCAFVLSTGRTGTKTIAALLGLSKQVFAYHEPKPLVYGLSRLAYENYHEPLAIKVLQEAFITARRDLLDFSLASSKGYVETSPQVTFLARAIAAAIPGALFIHLTRDPRDVIRSGMRRQWYVGNPNDQYRISPKTGTEEFSKWESYSAFQKNIWSWRETNRWIVQFCKQLPARSFLLLRAEDIFDGNQETLTRLYTFLGLCVPSKTRIEDLLRNRLNAQRKGDFPEPSEWPDTWNQDLRGMAGNTAQELGYEIENG
jgi:hypothetical protein